MPETSEQGWTSADTAAAAQIVSSGINYASAASANKKGRQWALEMYDRQRADALADWNMQNQYNSPAANMARLKAGGLNPNLVYGNGTNTPSVNVRSASSDTFNPQAPRADIQGAANSLLQGVALRNTAAQTDNLRVQNELLKQQILNTAAQTQNIGQNTARSQFDLNQLKLTAANDIMQKETTLRKTQADVLKTEADTEAVKANTQYTLDQNERAALLNNQSLAKGLIEIANLRTAGAVSEATRNQINQSIKNAEKDGILKQLDIELKRTGLQPHDPAYMRMAKKILDQLWSPKKFHDEVNAFIKKLASLPVQQPNY